LNGICDHECNKVGCDYDRDDCLPTQSDNLLGTIILQLEIDKQTFEKQKDLFLQRFSKRKSIFCFCNRLYFFVFLGSILNSPVKISLNKDGSELILPWYKDGNDKTKPIGYDILQMKKTILLSSIVFFSIKIYITILKTCNTSTSSNCQFDSVRQSVDYLGALQQNGELAQRLQMPISDINILPDRVQPIKDKSQYIYLVVIVACFLFLTFLVGYGLIHRPKRIIKAPVWWPSIFIDENKRELPWINRTKAKNTNYDLPNNKRQKSEHYSLSPDCESISTNTLNIPGGPNGDMNVLALEISRRDPTGKYEADEEESLNFFLNRRTDINSRVGDNKESVLHLACRLRRIVAVQTLINRGCDVNARDLHGATPLLRAVSANAFNIVQFLLTNANILKLDINASTYVNEKENGELPGDNPLRKAIRAKYNDIAECLLIAGADVDATDRDESIGGNETRTGTFDKLKHGRIMKLFNF
jgi:ankyrin repeat protein